MKEEKVMSFISTTYSVKALVTALRRKRGLGERRVSSPQSAREAVKALDPYIYEKLFIPIVRDGKVPVRGLDIYRVTESELRKLYELLTKSAIPEYVKCGLIFESPPPASSGKPIFI
jgi:hypothetical protein